MRSNIVIGLMIVVLLVLMVSIFRHDKQEKCYIEDMEKIEKLEVARYTNQIVVVSVFDEKARLSLYEKNVEKDSAEMELEAEKKAQYWELILETDALIGREGLGKRKEGDGKTPIGLFCFTKAFGILENPGTKVDYVQVDESHYWIDDGGSQYYNQFVSIDEVEQDWESAEHICEYGESYHYVLATSYNVEGIKGAGSAVFLHCTNETTESTAGCIAIPEIYMKEIIKRIEPDCVLIIDKADNIINY